MIEEGSKVPLRWMAFKASVVNVPKTRYLFGNN